MCHTWRKFQRDYSLGNGNVNPPDTTDTKKQRCHSHEGGNLFWQYRISMGPRLHGDDIDGTAFQRRLPVFRNKKPIRRMGHFVACPTDVPRSEQQVGVIEIL